MSTSDGIGKLPDRWDAKPLRSVADYIVSNVDKVVSEDETPIRLCNYTDVYHNEYITSGLDFMHATASEDEISKFGLLVNDIVITKDSEAWDDIGVPALVRETADDLVCGYHLALLRPHIQVMDGSFLFRCFQAKPIRLQLELSARGITRFGLSKSEIGATRIPVPPLSQQRAIADYLDRETARLDALVAAKGRVLALLAEKRQALVTSAVTRGLDCSIPLRDSVIPGVARIPAHWETIRLRFVTTGVEQGWSPAAANHQPSMSEWGVLKLNAVNQGRFDDTASKTLPNDIEPRTDLEVHRGDVLITRSNTPTLVGDACFIEKTRPKLMLSDIIYRLNISPQIIDGKLLAYFLTIPAGRIQIENDARGTSASMVKISQAHIKNWRIPVPPITEQRTIVDYLDRETAGIDGLATKARETITLLRERRAALIAAAVTGRIDVERAA